MWLAVAHNVDGILYYSTDGWNAQGQPKLLQRINGTMVADVGAVLWGGGNASAGRDGDGALLYPGPHGPLPSLRLLNIADGGEDAQLFVRHTLPLVIHLARIDLPSLHCACFSKSDLRAAAACRGRCRRRSGCSLWVSWCQRAISGLMIQRRWKRSGGRQHAWRYNDNSTRTMAHPYLSINSPFSAPPATSAAAVCPRRERAQPDCQADGQTAAWCHRTLSATQRWPPPLRRCLNHMFSSIASIHCRLISRPTAPFASDSRSAAQKTRAASKLRAAGER